MKENEKISLLLRHADRDDIPQGSFGNEILLNEKGTQNAQRFGEILSERKINRIFKTYKCSHSWPCRKYEWFCLSLLQ